MAVQTKGKCKYCGKEYARGYMIRHLSSCKERKARLESEAGKKKQGYFELAICGKYNRDYWLVIEVKDTATLEDVDEFLRDIWLECCGHLSAFEIDGESYEVSPDPDPFWGGDSKSMDYKLKSVLHKGMTVGYEYDFGSTTELVIEVKDHRVGCDREEAVTILSRNNPEVFMCGECGRREAVYVAPQRVYDGNPFLCEECGDLEKFEDEYLLRVCNSPRMGVCGYEGSDSFPDQFEPDSEGEE